MTLTHADYKLRQTAILNGYKAFLVGLSGTEESWLTQHEAAQQLDELAISVVGEDSNLQNPIGDGTNPVAVGYNELRAELRHIITGTPSDG